MFKNKLMVGLSIGLAIFAVGYVFNHFQATEVQVRTVLRGELAEYIEVRGKVEMDRKELISSKWSGVVGDILVREGNMVQPDTALLSLKVLNSGNAAAELEKARISKQAALRDFNYKNEKLEKYRKLYREGIVSEEEVKDLEMAVTAAEAARVAAEQQYKIVADNFLVNSSLGLESGNGRLTVRAGTTGKILAKYVDSGVSVVSGAPLFEVERENSAYYVRADVLTDDAVKLKLGQTAILTGEALDDAELPGKIVYIAPKAETTLSSLGVEQQRVEVRISYSYQDLPLRLGYGVDVKIVAALEPDAIFVPEKAVFEKEGIDHVLAIEENKLKLLPVKTGIENDDYIQILEGLREGDKIAVDPDNKLKPGMRVKIRR
ncbi:MAG: efflux RND transporter periplasmic adaptor subunit [Firmicutes bacterium]|nr:efflux RND transporter periplasmic adaptor subunit [Bacillota bacterium]